MAITLDRDELDLYLWNTSTLYFKGLEIARIQKAKGGATLFARWARLYSLSVAQYRAEIGPCRPVKGLKAEMVKALESTFMEHLAECDAHEAKKSAEAHLGKAQA